MPKSFEYQNNIAYDQSVTILDSATESSTADLHGCTLVGLVLPAGLEGTSMTFKSSDSLDGTYYGIFDQAGNAASFTVAASRYVSFDLDVFKAVRYLKVVAGTSQTGSVEIGLVLKAE